jgi:ribosomal protein S18 acetylase RimI-like enzyme
MLTESLKVRRITLEDLDDVVAVHCTAFPTSAMTRLGAEVVRRYYYWQLDGPHEMYARGAWEEGKLVGFCFGGVHPQAITGFYKRNRGFIFWQFVKQPHLATAPFFFGKLVRVLNMFRIHRRELAAVPQEAPQNPAYDILAMAVHPDRQSVGIGKLLMENAESKARERRFELMTLCVNDDNERGIRFYESCGWQRTTHVNGMWCMEKRLLE